MDRAHLDKAIARGVVLWQNDSAKMYATATATYFMVEGDTDIDMVYHQPGCCHLCGFRFTRDCPESERAHWCADCYERFALNDGRLYLANSIEECGYRIRPEDTLSFCFVDTGYVR